MFPISFLRFGPAISSSKRIGNYLRKSRYSPLILKKEIACYDSNVVPISFNIVCYRCMAGHAKWQNIKHIKAAKDKEKTAICNRYVRMIGYAVREMGPDPKANIKLANLLEEGKKHNIPKDTLESALKRGTNKKNKYGTMEVLGPGGCMVIIEFETDNISTARYEIKIICKKYSANILSGEGRWRAIFDLKGIITSAKELIGGALNEGKAIDTAIEAGAEEVQMKEDEEGNNFLEFVCAPDDLHKVKKELEKHYDVQESYVAYIPRVTVKLSDEDMVAVDGFLEDLGNLSDVVRLYENVQ